MYALDFVPAEVARERERFGAYAARTMGGNLLADLVQEEVSAAYASSPSTTRPSCSRPTRARLPYQLCSPPGGPRARFEDEGPIGAALLHDALRRLAGASARSPR